MLFKIKYGQAPLKKIEKSFIFHKWTSESLIVKNHLNFHEILINFLNYITAREIKGRS